MSVCISSSLYINVLQKIAAFVYPMHTWVVCQFLKKNNNFRRNKVLFIGLIFFSEIGTTLFFNMLIGFFPTLLYWILFLCLRRREGIMFSGCPSFRMSGCPSVRSWMPAVHRHLFVLCQHGPTNWINNLYKHEVTHEYGDDLIRLSAFHR